MRTAIKPAAMHSATVSDIAAKQDHALTIGPFGSDLKVSDYQQNGVPIIFVRDIEPNRFAPKQRRYVSDAKASKLAAHRVLAGDLVITKMGTPPCVAAVYPADQPPGIVTADIIKLSLDNRIADAGYVAHLLNSPLARSKVLCFTFGITRPKVTLRDFKTLRLPLPALPQQRRIAEVLDRAEALRAKRRAALALLDTLTQSIFLDMFGDPSLNAKNWKRVTLGEVATFSGGGTPSRDRPEYFAGTVCWATPKDMKNETLEDTEEHITEEAISNSATKLVPADTILVVVKSKVLAHRLPVAISRVSICFGQDIKGISVASDCEVAFVATALRIGARWLLDRARGANTEGLTLDHLRAFPMLHPPPPLQRDFGRRAQAVDNLKTTHRTSLAKLDELFASLQHRAFRGEL